VLIGTAIWTASNRIAWPAIWQGLLVAMTAGAAALLTLSPFQWTDEPTAFTFMPFFGHYTRTTFETLSHVFETLLCYFPLGMGIGLARGGRGAFLAALGLALAIAAPLEYLQMWVIGRYPDVSDIGVALLGAAVGMAAATYAGDKGQPDGRQ
jgi:VanZ family protein